MADDEDKRMLIQRCVTAANRGFRHLSFLVFTVDQQRSSAYKYAILLFLSTIIMSSAITINADDSEVIVRTTSGKLAGTRRTHQLELGKKTDIFTETVDEFLGVPYAAPPVGHLRFEAPTEYPPWSDVRYAKSVGPSCPQKIYVTSKYNEGQHEDCLYLNIYSPYLESRQRKNTRNLMSNVWPVMVYIHGGSFMYGTGNTFNGTALAMFGVVVVTINYRLGSLGFLTTGTKELPGNYGILDQIFALEWIRRNVFAFRGDPNCVTIFGNSAGGASVGLLFLSPLATGLFHRVIAQSGTANALWATHADKTERGLTDDVIDIATSQSCLESSLNETIDCLRLVPWHRLSTDEICTVISCTEIDPPMKPVIDGRVLTDHPSKLLKEKKFNSNIPYMTGTVRHEFGTYAYGNYSSFYMWKEVDSYLKKKFNSAVLQIILLSYKDWTKRGGGDLRTSDAGVEIYDRAEVLSDLGLLAPTVQMAYDVASAPGGAAYVYYLDVDDSYHSVELNYIFGLPFLGGSVDENGREFLPELSSEAMKRTSVSVMRLWTDFAKYGRFTPQSSGKSSDASNVTWTKFDSSTGGYLRIRSNSTDHDLSMLANFRLDKTILWNFVVPGVVGRCCDDGRRYDDVDRTTGTDDERTKISTLIGFVVVLSVLFVFVVCFNVCGWRRGFVRFGRRRRRGGGEDVGDSKTTKAANV